MGIGIAPELVAVRGSGIESSVVSLQPVPARRRVADGRWAACAAVLGGTAWTLKAGVTLVTGDEPPLAFVIGLVLFPFALLGLRSMLGRTGGRAAWIGGVAATIAAVCAAVLPLVRVVGGKSVEPSEDEVTLLTPLITGASVGTLVALIALGIAVRETRMLAPGYSSLPLTMGLAIVPLLIVGSVLESLSARLLEVPVALLGLAWIALGLALWAAARQRREAPVALDER